MANKVYTFVSRSKLARAKMSLGKDHTEAELLVVYDRIGGLVLEDGKKMKYGNYFKPKKEVKIEVKKEVKKEVKETKKTKDAKPAKQPKKKNNK